MHHILASRSHKSISTSSGVRENSSVLNSYFLGCPNNPPKAMHWPLQNLPLATHCLLYTIKWLTLNPTVKFFLHTYKTLSTVISAPYIPITPGYFHCTDLCWIFPPLVALNMLVPLHRMSTIPTLSPSLKMPPWRLSQLLVKSNLPSLVLPPYLVTPSWHLVHPSCFIYDSVYFLALLLNFNPIKTNAYLIHHSTDAATN